MTARMLEANDASGEAKPTAKIDAPAIVLKYHAIGTLKTKVHNTLLSIEKNERPHPLKKPFVQKTTGTRMYSKQKLLA